MVHKVCQEWLQDLPPLICCRGRPEFALSTLKNGRRKMEDRHSVCVDVNTLYDFKVWTMFGPVWASPDALVLS